MSVRKTIEDYQEWYDKYLHDKADVPQSDEIARWVANYEPEGSRWHVLVSDESGHDYVIPEGREGEFEDLINDEDLEEFPAWADLKEGLFRFKEYEC